MSEEFWIDNNWLEDIMMPEWKKSIIKDFIYIYESNPNEIILLCMRINKSIKSHFFRQLEESYYRSNYYMEYMDAKELLTEIGCYINSEYDVYESLVFYIVNKEIDTTNEVYKLFKVMSLVKILQCRKYKLAIEEALHKIGITGNHIQTKDKEYEIIM